MEINKEDCIKGDFLIAASSETVLFNRQQKLREITGFNYHGDPCKDDDCNVYRILPTANFENLEALKNKINLMRKYKWFFLSDSCIMFDGEYLFSDGEWLI